MTGASARRGSLAAPSVTACRYREVCNGRQLDRVDELLTPDHVYHDPQIPNVIGSKAMAQALAVHQTGLNEHWQVEEILAAEHDRAVVRGTGTGTHTGVLNGSPPTGKPVRGAAIHLFRLEGDTIAEQWCVWDTLGMLQPLGVVPPPAQPTA